MFEGKMSLIHAMRPDFIIAIIKKFNYVIRIDENAVGSRAGLKLFFFSHLFTLNDAYVQTPSARGRKGLNPFHLSFQTSKKYLRRALIPACTIFCPLLSESKSLVFIVEISKMQLRDLSTNLCETNIATIQYPSFYIISPMPFELYSNNPFFRKIKHCFS